MVMVVLHVLVAVLDEVFQQVIMAISNAISVEGNFVDMVTGDFILE